jgi:predicted permease
VNHVETFFADIRYSIRVLRKQPSFFATAVIALALGIGANTAIFSVVDAVLIRPLPYADPSRVVMVWEDSSFAGFPQNTPAPANYVDWRRMNRVFTDMAATRNRVANLTGDGRPEMVVGRAATANLFSILGVKPFMGRTFTEEEDRAGVPVVVITYELWNRRFGSDPNLVGKGILMNGQSTTVLGIMPQGFTLPGRGRDYWVPSGLTPQDLARRGSHFLNVFARLRPGVTVEQAQVEMSAIARNLEKQYPQNRKIGAVVVPIKDQLVGTTKVALYVLLGAAGCVLLIACANLANLLLAKATGRRREIAVRAAIGAGRGRLVRQLITESIVLSLAGGVLGLALANWGLAVLKQLVPRSITETPSLNSPVLLFALGLSVVTGVVFGLAPALRLSRLDLHDVLKQGGRGGLGGRATLLRDALVVAEVALAMVLLVGAGLLIQTLVRLRAVAPGFNTEKLLTMQTVLPRPKYEKGVQRQAFFDAVLERVRQMPGFGMPPMDRICHTPQRATPPDACPKDAPCRKAATVCSGRGHAITSLLFGHSSSRADSFQATTGPDRFPLRW